MIIFLLGAGNGLINAQLDQQSRHLANSIKIFGGQTSKPFKGLEKGRFITLKESDVEITDKTFSDNTSNVGSEISVNGINIYYGYYTPVYQKDDTSAPIGMVFAGAEKKPTHDSSKMMQLSKSATCSRRSRSCVVTSTWITRSSNLLLSANNSVFRDVWT